MAKSLFIYRPKYLFLTIVILCTEIIIALFIKDKFIRPYFGDFLVVILLYCMLRTFLGADYRKLAAGVWLFAVIVEVAQFYKLVEVLGIKQNETVAVMIGSSFDWLDIAAYTAGIILIFLVEKNKNYSKE